MKNAFVALNTQVQNHISNSNDTKLKLNQLHSARYEPSFFLMEGIRKAVDEQFGSSSSSTVSTSSNKEIQAPQQQVTHLQTSNDQLTAQVRALTTLVESQQTDIKTLVDSHKHLQM